MNIILILLALLVGCSNPVGEEFQDFDAIGLSKTWKDWVIIGHFGPDGPFKLVDMKACDVSEPCSFSHGGQGHTYNNFIGYKISVLRLENSQENVSHVVLRSSRKFDGSSDDSQSGVHKISEFFRDLMEYLNGLWRKA